MASCEQSFSSSLTLTTLLLTWCVQMQTGTLHVRLDADGVSVTYPATHGAWRRPLPAGTHVVAHGEHIAIM